MLSHLKKIIPGAEQWNTFTHNQSAQFEARLIQLKITKSPSILLADMEECILPTVVSHGEGRINHTQPNQTLPPKEIQCAHYVDSHHQITTQYPANPNGSTDGITALTSTDGRATIMMPHPERTFRLSQYSWHPKD
jgi:phosphoribosylformylglycinamidine synthase